MFTFKSGAPGMDFTNSDLWNGGLGADLTAEYRCLGGWSSDPPHRGAHLSLYPIAMSMAWGLQQSTPGFHSSLVPRPCPLLLSGGMLFLEPILTVPLKTTADNWVWRLRLPLSVFPPGFPSSDEELFSAWLWNQPITKGAWQGTFQTWVSLEPPSPLGHNQGQALHCYSCILFFFNQSIFSFFIFKYIFFNVDHFKSLYWIYYNIASVLCFGFLAPRHGRS